MIRKGQQLATPRCSFGIRHWLFRHAALALALLVVATLSARAFGREVSQAPGSIVHAAEDFGQIGRKLSAPAREAAGSAGGKSGDYQKSEGECRVAKERVRSGKRGARSCELLFFTGHFPLFFAAYQHRVTEHNVLLIRDGYDRDHSEGLVWL